jgi:3',5'-cyclic AMP phosphodiesterase CpdA
MRLVHLGDIHAYRLFVPPWRLIGKALVGQANLWLRRRRHFHRHLLAPVLQQVAQVKPDILLISGDLTTTAVRGEFQDVADALSTHLPGVPTVIVPGNHDRYTVRSLRKRRIETMLPDRVPAPFPHVRALGGRWRLLALDASVPRAVTSRGLLGEAQLRGVKEVVTSMDETSGLVVLCHYPFGVPPELPPMRWHHCLCDAAQLREILGFSRGKVLFLHGHVHQPWRWQPADLPQVIDLNAGAPCLVGPIYTHGQGFWQVELPDDPRQPLQTIHHVPGSGGWEQKRVV